MRSAPPITAENTGAATAPRWSSATFNHDGSKLVIVEQGSMKLLATDGGALLATFPNEPGTLAGNPEISPDGTMLVWRAAYPESAADSADYLGLLARKLVRPTRLELWVARADGSEPRQVTQLGAASFAPYFHPDGRRIIFASNYPDRRSRNFDLYLVNLDGSGLERVTTSPEFDAFPMFSPDGRRLVFASNRNAAQPGETNIFIADWAE